jgi:ParB family chromosome partitioning protein
MTQYEIHPAAHIFPMMTRDEYQGLKTDIIENGQLEPIIIWQGKVLDGRNRLLACRELGLQPYVETIRDNDDPCKYVISHNLHRRHLTTSQRADVAGKLATLKHGGDRKSSDQELNLALDAVAKQLNVSVASVKLAKQVHAKGSEEVKQAVTQGKLRVSAAAKLVKEVPNKQEQTLVLKKPPKPSKSSVPKSKLNLSEFKKRWEDANETEKQQIRTWVLVEYSRTGGAYASSIAHQSPCCCDA